MVIPATPSAPPSFHRYRFASAEFDETTNLLQVAGSPVTVEPLPLQLLAELLRRPTANGFLPSSASTRSTGCCVTSGANAKISRAWST